MPKIVLNARGQEASIPAGLLVVRAFVSPGPAAARVLAIARAGEQVPVPVAPPPPGTVVVGVDHIDGTTVRVEAIGSFAPGSTVTVILEVGLHAVEIGPLATAGVSSQDVASLQLAQGRIVVRVAAGDGDIVELSPLGETARAATADLLGTTRVGEADRLAATIVVDGSASFRSIPAGVIGRAVELLSGLIAVTAEYRVSAAVSGPTVIRDSIDDLADLPAAVGALLSSASLSSGARLGDAELFRTVADARTLVWVLTDDVPPDLAKLAAVSRAGDGAVNVVVIAHASMAPADELAGIPITFLDSAVLAEADPSPREPALADTVRALLRPVFGPDSRAHRKATA